MKTTCKTLPLICLMMAIMLLMASCNFNLFPGKDNDTTTTDTTTATNSSQETPIDISKIPESKGLLYQACDDGTCVVYGIGTCRDSVVRIPEAIDGYRVTKLTWGGEGESVEEILEQLERVNTLIIPKTVTEIYSEAFVRGNLNAIVVDTENPIYYSEGNCVIEKISKTLVLGCNGSVIPKDVKRIGDCAFAICTDLKTITIPAGVTNIEPISIFLYCPNLTNVTVDSNNATYYTKGTCLIEKATETVIASWGDPVIVPKTVKNIPYPFYGFDESIFGFLNEITFEGTKAEWNNVTFDSTYLYWGQVFTVHCTDGDIMIEGTYVSGGNENCEHVFISNCDTQCENCNAHRDIYAVHTYSFDCAERCSVCGHGYRETDVPHTYYSACDEYCDVCGEGRTPPATHQLDERSMWPDFTCLICGDEILIAIEEYVYRCDSCDWGEIARSCDKSFCDHCGAEYDAVHRYSSATDFDCYMCGHIRELEN